jgi:cyclic pyranopterin monophosphate synthase
MTNRLTHFDAKGQPTMVDVSHKAPTLRTAIARGHIRMTCATLDMVLQKEVAKGDVIAVAQLAGIMAAKRTPDLIPLCHPLPLTSVSLDIVPDLKLTGLIVTAHVKTTGPTGVEMEALTAVSIACLTIYDMLKAAQKSMVIGDICLMSKAGGNSGDYVAPDA